MRLIIEFDKAVNDFEVEEILKEWQGQPYIYKVYIDKGCGGKEKCNVACNVLADGWRRVEDELPPKDLWILVYQKVHHCDNEIEDYMDIRKYSSKYNCWESAGGDGYCGMDSYWDYEFTHWMPLPKPPTVS